MLIGWRKLAHVKWKLENLKSHWYPSISIRSGLDAGFELITISSLRKGQGRKSDVFWRLFLTRSIKPMPCMVAYCAFRPPLVLPPSI